MSLHSAQIRRIFRLAIVMIMMPISATKLKHTLFSFYCPTSSFSSSRPGMASDGSVSTTNAAPTRPTTWPHNRSTLVSRSRRSWSLRLVGMYLSTGSDTCRSALSHSAFSFSLWCVSTWNFWINRTSRSTWYDVTLQWKIAKRQLPRRPSSYLRARGVVQSTRHAAASVP